MNWRIRNQRVTVLLGAGSALLSLQVDREPLYLRGIPNETTTALEPQHRRSAGSGEVRGKAQTPARNEFMERDLTAQIKWMMGKAQRQGFADLDELLHRAPELYMQLATLWRQGHPIPRAA